MNLMGIRTAHVGWLAAALLAAQGCRGRAQPGADSQERLNLITNPSMYLDTDGFGFDDEGHRLGSSRFALSGSVPALGSRSFRVADGTMTSGTLRGGALRVTIT